MESLQKRRPGDPASRRIAPVGLLALALAVNIAQWAWIASLEARWQADAERYRAQIESAEHTRDLAVEQLGEIVLQAEADKQARAEQTGMSENAPSRPIAPAQSAAGAGRTGSRLQGCPPGRGSWLWTRR